MAPLYSNGVIGIFNQEFLLLQGKMFCVPWINSSKCPEVSFLSVSYWLCHFSILAAQNLGNDLRPQNEVNCKWFDFTSGGLPFFVCDWHWHSVPVWHCFWPGPCLIFQAFTPPWLEVWVVLYTDSVMDWSGCVASEFQCPISGPLSVSGAHNFLL